jgi:hypothetical protein
MILEIRAKTRCGGAGITSAYSKLTLSKVRIPPRWHNPMEG